jgi:SAM-dependent methyltransferase
MNKIKRYIEANREAWEEAFDYHERAKGREWLENFSSKGYTTFSPFEKDIYSRLNLRGRSVVQAPCNNGREIISFLNLGAEYGAGFDISGKNIAFANKLKEVSDSNADFYKGDVYEIDKGHFGRFDVGIISVGSFNWMPNLKEYLHIYKNLLKEGGDLLILEMHPLTTVFPYSFKGKQEVVFEESYFNRSPYRSNQSLDYYGGTEYRSRDKYEFQHTMGDIIQALIELDLQIVEFEEHPEDLGGGHEYLEEGEVVPLSYHLWVKKRDR